MTQTKTGSFIEAWMNIAIGYTINFVGNILIFPLFGYKISLSAAFWVGIVLTFTSVFRQYVLRRWFNSLRLWNRKE